MNDQYDITIQSLTGFYILENKNKPKYLRRICSFSYFMRAIWDCQIR